MQVTYQPASEEVNELIAAVMGKHHQPLEQVSLEVKGWFAYAERDEAGLPKGMALKLHGYACMATVKVNNLKQRVQGLGDAEIMFDGDRWDDLAEEEQFALIDHELCHLMVKVDKVGAVKMDAHGRPLLKMRLHDWQIGGFREVVQRHGANALDLQVFDALMASDGQLLFPWAKREPSAVNGKAKTIAAVSIGQLEAARALIPRKGSGLDSITISSGGKSHTLDRETGKRIDKELKRRRAAKHETMVLGGT